MKKQIGNRKRKSAGRNSVSQKRPINRGASKKGNKSAFIANQTLVGTVQGSGRGFAFFIPSDESGDLFIAAKNLNGAMHGDTVEAVKISSRRANGEA